MAHEHLWPAEAKRPSCNLWGVVESVWRRGFTRSSAEQRRGWCAPVVRANGLTVAVFACNVDAKAARFEAFQVQGFSMQSNEPHLCRERRQLRTS